MRSYTGSLYRQQDTGCRCVTVSFLYADYGPGSMPYIFASLKIAVTLQVDIVLVWRHLLSHPSLHKTSSGLRRRGAYGLKVNQPGWS